MPSGQPCWRQPGTSTRGLPHGGWRSTPGSPAARAARSRRWAACAGILLVVPLASCYRAEQRPPAGPSEGRQVSASPQPAPAPAPGPALPAAAPAFPPPVPEAALAADPPPVCPSVKPRVQEQVTAALEPHPASRKKQARAADDALLPERLAALGAPAAGPLLDALLRLAPERRPIAFRTLARLAHPCAVAALVPLAARGEPATARDAAETLLAIAHPAARQAVALAAARPDLPLPRPLVRGLAEQAVQHPALAAEATTLLGWLAGPAHPAAIRAAAADGLGRLEDPRIEPLFAWLVLHDPDPLVRQQAAEGLVGRLHADYLPAAVRALDDPFGPVAAGAAAALGASGLAEQALPPLLAYLGSGRKEAVDPVLQAVALLGDRTIAYRLAPLLRDRDAYLQASAAQVLARLGGAAAAAEPLLAQLCSPLSAVRRSAAAALASLEVRQALPELERMARHDPDPTVQTVAAAGAEVLRALP